jgi:hypothetical protein
LQRRTERTNLETKYRRTLQEKAGAPNIRRATAVVATVGKRISGRPKGKTSLTRVEKVRQDNILGSDRAGSEHSKACLHKVDESSLLCAVTTELADKTLCVASCKKPASTCCKDKEKGIDTRRNIGRFEKCRLPEEKPAKFAQGLVDCFCCTTSSLTKQTYCFLSIGHTLQKPVGVVAGVLDCQFALLAPRAEHFKGSEPSREAKLFPVRKWKKSRYSVGISSFAMTTIGGLAKEEQRRMATMPSSLLASSGEISPATSDASVMIVSSGYGDEAIKIHSADNFRIVASETGRHRGPVRYLSIGDDGCLMVTGGQDGTLWSQQYGDGSIRRLHPNNTWCLIC